MPTQIAKAMARPPTIVRPGYFTSKRPPSLKSSHFIELLLPMPLRTAAEFVPRDERCDVSADGQRFLMIKAPVADANTAPPTIVVVQHWDEELKRLLPPKQGYILWAILRSHTRQNSRISAGVPSDTRM